METAEFDYQLPEEAIAQSAVEPRDAARLLDTRDGADRRFSDLPGMLRPGDLLVVNRTRVRRARLIGEKAGSGGQVEALLLRARGDGTWEALMRPARRLRPGVLLRFGPLVASVADGPVDGEVVLRAEEGSFDEAIAAVGLVPLPPYFHGQLADSERYQTVYGDRAGSAAAPTAGLHFTAALLAAMKGAGVGVASVDLDIGLDTFRPITVSRLDQHQMHRERISVGSDAAEAIASARAAGGRVVAVGTTVVRALESAAAGGGLVSPVEQDTALFITPGHRFEVVDLLLTNFHAPGTTLVVLLAAFIGPRWRDTYSLALERGYRFLSFGDSMLAERA